MADIKIDISAIVNKYFFPLLISGVVGLLLFQLYFHNWIWPTIIAILFFLLIELLIWCRNVLHQKSLDKEYEIQRADMVRTQMRRIADNALCFFRSLDNYHLEAAVALYKHPIIPNSYYNERYVEFGELPISNYLSVLSFFDSCYSYKDISYVRLTNEMNSYNGGKSHFIIDPFFYEILRNYVENNEINYPKGFDIMQFRKYYNID